GLLGGISLGIFADGTYGAGWNGIGADSYLGKAGQGVTGLLYGDSQQFLCQLFGATMCACWAFGVTFVVFKLVNSLRSIRVARRADLEGLDLAEFGGLAYPEDALAIPVGGASGAIASAAVAHGSKSPVAVGAGA